MCDLDELQEQISVLEESIERIEAEISDLKDLIDNASDNIPDYIMQNWENKLEICMKRRATTKNALKNIKMLMTIGMNVMINFIR